MSQPNKHFRPVLCIAGLIFFLISQSAAQAQTVREYISVDSLTVGDDFTFILTLSKDQPYEEIIFPDSANFDSTFEIRNVQQFKVTDFKDSLVYQLQFFGTKDAAVPRLPVKLVDGSDTTTVYTAPHPVYFKSVLQGEEESFRPLKPIFDFAAAWWPYLLGLLILAAAGWYLYKLYKKQSLQPEPEPVREFNPSPFIDPLETLASTLRQLRGYSLEDQEDFKQFYINLGDAIRLYFERLYRIPALESTSREILTEMNRRALDDDLIRHTRRVLNEADMVKFARFTPTQDQARDALEKADAFLKRAQEVDRPRVDHLQRQHHARVESQRRQYELELEKEGGAS